MRPAVQSLKAPLLKELGAWSRRLHRLPAGLVHVSRVPIRVLGSVLTRAPDRREWLATASTHTLCLRFLGLRLHRCEPVDYTDTIWPAVAVHMVSVGSDKRR